MAEPDSETLWMASLLTRLAVASGVGYWAAAYAVSRWLTRPTLGALHLSPDDYGLAWEPLECRTDDAFRLAGWVITPARPRATVVLFHGVRANRSQTLERCAFLSAAGYRCVAFDHRAHGESSGKRTSFGYLESRDVVAVLNLVRRRWPNQPRALLGISMGGAAICYAAAHVTGAAAVILESVYYDIGDAFKSRIGTGFPPWFRQLSDGVVRATERRLGLRLEQLAPVRYLSALAPTPILFLTGSDDAHASPADTLRLRNSYPGPHEFLLVPNAGHEDVYPVGGAVYRRSILSFLERQLFRRVRAAG